MVFPMLVSWLSKRNAIRFGGRRLVLPCPNHSVVIVRFVALEDIVKGIDDNFQRADLGVGWKDRRHPARLSTVEIEQLDLEGDTSLRKALHRRSLNAPRRCSSPA